MSSTPVHVRRPTGRDRPRLAELAARLQRRPDRHVTYLGLDADTIAAEMVAEDDDWTAVAAVAERDGEPVGWLMGSVDVALGRVWWFGPFVETDAGDWGEIVDALHEIASSTLPAAVTQQEWAPDARFELMIDWGLAHGFHRDPGSAVLTLDGAIDDTRIGPSAIDLRPVVADDVATVGRLHEELFPGTHTTGTQLVEGANDAHVRLVAERGGELVGYVAVEVQPDGSGYIDFLGVAHQHRGQGVGARLVRAGVDALRERGCDACHLTVREANVVARRLYTSLGFTEERLIVPLRRGFSLP